MRGWYSSKMSAFPPGFKFNSTLGALFIGTVVVAILFGVTSVQIYYYFSHYSNDKRILRLAVAALWAIDLLHLFGVCHLTYHYTITNFAQPTALSSIVWSYKLQVVIETINDVIIRLILLHRVWHLSEKNKYIGGFTLICATTIVAIGTACFVEG